MKIPLNLKWMMFGTILCLNAGYLLTVLIKFVTITLYIASDSFTLSTVGSIVVGIIMFCVVLCSAVVVSKNVDIIQITKKNVVLSTLMLIFLFVANFSINNLFFLKSVVDEHFHLIGNCHVLGESINSVLLLVLAVLAYKGIKKHEQTSDRKSFTGNYNKFPSMVFGVIIYLIVTKMLSFIVAAFHITVFLLSTTGNVEAFTPFLTTGILILLVCMLATRKKTVIISKRSIIVYLIVALAISILAEFIWKMQMPMGMPNSHLTVSNASNNHTYIFKLILFCAMASIICFVPDRTEDKKVLKEKLGW